jgi:hypothetical protein
MSDLSLKPVPAVEPDYIFVQIEDAISPGVGTLVLSSTGSGVPAVAASLALTRDWLALDGECIRLRLLLEQAVAKREAWRDRMAGTVRDKNEAIYIKERKLLNEKALRLLEAKLKHIANGGDL